MHDTTHGTHGAHRGWTVLAACLLVVVVSLLAGPGGRSRGGEGEGESAGLVRIAGGTVRLGSGAEEKAYGYRIGSKAARRWRWFDRERAREVTLAPYLMERTLVTQEAYARFVRATGHRAPHISPAAYRAQGFLVHPYREVRPYLWRGGRPPASRLRHPVVLVSVADARAYCAWRGRRRKRTCRLPTEDQWELAARGPRGLYFPWGNTWDPNRANTAARGPYGTTPVDAYPAGASPYGLLDMAGNVFQWTRTPGRSGRHVLKGCSWDDAPGICRGAARHDRPAPSRHILIGFRCACEAAPP